VNLARVNQTYLELSKLLGMTPEKEHDLSAIPKLHQTGSDKEFEISVQKNP